MTKKNEIDQLKLLAKRYARSSRQTHRDALDAIALKLGCSHWASLASKAKRGWIPSATEMTAVEELVRQCHPTLGEKGTFIEHRMSLPVDEPVKEGKIGGHTYRVYEALGDIRMEGDGWRILVGEADYSQPVVEIETTHSDTSPAKDREFLDKALVIADEEAAKVRAGIASDWPRRSTKPDAEGNVVHPLFGGRSADWYCLHCDGKITGAQIAENLWHCPDCGASPIDIHSSSNWLVDGDDEPRAVVPASDKKRPEPRNEVVDSRPTLRLNEESISLLLRIALLEDAATPSQRIGALLAEISIDDENDAWITLDEDLWPEFKEPEATIAVADTLGTELELVVTCMKHPFAWPGLGHVNSSTLDYVAQMLAAYKEHGVVIRENSSD
jgi:hypothetical protein